MFCAIGCGNKLDVSIKDYQKPTETAQVYCGIDVSHYQGNIDWNLVAQDTNIQFVYIKATEGKSYLDDKYKQNIEQARNVGLSVGSYHFFRMTSSPQEQFENITNNIDKNQQDLIPMIDVETTDGKSVDEVRNALKKLTNLMEKHYGKKTLIYGTMRSYNTICAPDFNDHLLYIGRFSDTLPPKIKGGGKAAVWQFSEKGRIKGIPRDVDLNRFHPDFNISAIKRIEYL
jgi:lysozyme